MLFAAVPIIFGNMRGLSLVQAELPFLAVYIGILFGGGAVILDMFRYTKLLTLRGVSHLPEERFKPMGVGAVILGESCR